MKHILLLVIFFSALALFAGESNCIRVETRAGFGGRIATGVEDIGSIDGSCVDQVNTTKMSDSWTTFTVGTASSSVCVLNEPSVEGGRLEQNTTWIVERVHIVRDNVVVPCGITLTLPYSCIVKFTEGARIYVEDGGAIEAKGAYLVGIQDDSVGGDTNHDGSGTSRTLANDEQWWNEDPVVAGLARVGIGQGDGVRVYSGFEITSEGELKGFSETILDEGDLVIPFGVTSIGDSAFECCHSITNLIVPASVRRIGDFSFCACCNLKTIKFQEGSSLESIGAEAFYGCSIESICLPESCRKISYGSFSSCDLLRTVLFRVPSLLEEIGDNAFGACESLQDVNLPDGLKVIGEEAFHGCVSLERITIPSGMDTISHGAFYECSSLETVVFAGDVDDIAMGGGVFAETPYSNMHDFKLFIKDGVVGGYVGTCPSSLTIPDGVIAIGDSAFSGAWLESFICPLQSVRLPSSLKVIGKSAFAFTSLVDADIPNGATRIGKSAFCCCEDLESVQLPSSLRVIGESAFDSCSSLMSVEIRPGVFKIDDYAFAWCSALESISVPAGLQRLGWGVFEDCDSLINVKLYGDVPDGLLKSKLLSQATSVYYPKAAAACYESIVDSKVFKGYSMELSIETTNLPRAKDGSSYEARLSCSGGTTPYSWTWSDRNYHVLTEPSTFKEVGVAQGWLASGFWFEGNSWQNCEYKLPFAFDCFGRKFESVQVAPDCCLMFKGSDGCFEVNTGLGGFEYYEDKNQDMYIESKIDRVSFRWYRRYRKNVLNCAITLYSNGVIRCSFGECYCDTREVEVCGDWLKGVYYACSGNDDVVLVPQCFPSGLSMTEGGTISGIPAMGGHNVFDVAVQDGSGKTCFQTLSLDVVDESIPELGDSPSSAEVYEALGGSADSKLQDNITDGENYNAFRTWAATVKKSDGSIAAGVQAVRNAPNAWLSYALGSQILIPTAPSDGDLKVEKFEPTSTTGSFDFTVSIEDVAVGAGATTENLKKVFGLEGGASLEDMSADKVNISFGTPENGKVKFTAGPKDTMQPTFFMKVKLTQ